jgi:cytochrome P450 / NADPH-cytochrome P450 reductase
LQWERFGPEAIIDPTIDYTKIAFDTIALCSMSYRYVLSVYFILSMILIATTRSLNSFYIDGIPEFASRMSDFLLECFTRSRRPALVGALMTATGSTVVKKYEEDIKFMADIARESSYNFYRYFLILAHVTFLLVLDQRLKHPETSKKDLLDLMINAKDPKTGKGLPEEAILNNVCLILSS